MEEGEGVNPKRSYAPDIHRLLPSNSDAEQGVLSSCLLAPDAIGLCIERDVSERWFHIPAHGMIYEVIVELWNAGKPTDFIAVTQELAHSGLLDSCGGASFVTQLYTLLPTAANIEYYIGILEEHYIARSIIRVGTEYAAKSYDHEGEVIQLLDRFERETMSIRKIRAARRQDVKTITMEVLDEFQHAYEHPGVVTGLRTGYHEFDVRTDGLQPEQMIVIAARPANGKTAFALGMVEELAIHQKRPTAVFSLEMSARQLVKRLLCKMAGVNWFAFRDGHVRESDFPALTRAAACIADAKDRLIIDDAAGQTIQEVRAKARRMKAEHGIEAVFIDYLQLLSSSNKRAQENRNQEVSESSNGCKQGARELGIPWVVLAQVGRDVEKDKRKPRLSDLRDSGSIEQDADTVCFLQRLDLMCDSEEERIEREGEAVLVIAKQRAGDVGDIRMHYHKETTTFTDAVKPQEQVELGLDAAPVKRQSRPHRRTKSDN